MQKIYIKTINNPLFTEFNRTDSNMELLEKQFFYYCSKNISQSLFNDFLKIIKNLSDVTVGCKMFDIINNINKPLRDSNYIKGLYYD